ncbi:ExeA family protein [Luteitalea sp.]|jgi:general secretion pathway protein A|uniref:ExeA family protein n=1 Tax=Luteitalea sp. TaxID=2004800 RepID=UPI0037C5D697
MYEPFFGLRERPFDLTPNPRYLFLTNRYREALGNLVYGLAGRKGLTVLTGEAGTGKTTLLTVALAQWREAGHLVATLRNPTMDRLEFLQFLAQEFGLSEAAAQSKTVMLKEFEALLRQRHAAGLLTALVIDEAHSLPTELLEEIRLLANIETPDTKLLPLILLGQPELADRLNDPSLRQLKQRVALRCSLVPLDLRETAAYLAKRIQLAGGDSLNLFTREAVTAIHHGSGGIPRLINVISDNALVNGFAAGVRPVGQDIIRDVCLDFDLPVLSATLPPGAAGAAQAVGSTAPPAAAVAVAPAVVAPAVAPPVAPPGILSDARVVPIGAIAAPASEPEPESEARSWIRWLLRPLSFLTFRDRA